MKQMLRWLATTVAAGILATVFGGAWPARVRGQSKGAAKAQATAQSSAKAPHITVTLLVEPQALRSGATIWLGLRFQPVQGWHIYWQNPGDSGEPPKVDWQVPKGFDVADVVWPAPERLGHGTIVDYGYTSDVMLLAPLHLDVEAAVPASAAVTANVSWLVCSDVCVPGKATLSVNVPAKPEAESAPAQRKLFSEALARVPRPWVRFWRASVEDAGKTFVLTLERGKPETQAVFFPLDAEQIQNSAAQTVVQEPRGVRITLRKSDGLRKPIQVLRGVVVFGDGKAFDVTAPVLAADASAGDATGRKP